MEHKFFIQVFTLDFIEVSRSVFLEQLSCCRNYPYAFPHEVHFHVVPGFSSLSVNSTKLHFLVSKH